MRSGVLDANPNLSISFRTILHQQIADRDLYHLAILIQSRRSHLDQPKVRTRIAGRISSTSLSMPSSYVFGLRLPRARSIINVVIDQGV